MGNGTWDAILEELVDTLRCAKCGRTYARSAMTFVGARADHHFVRCTCQRCHAEAVAIVIVKQIALGEPPAPERSFTKDDVMDAEELMRPAAVTLHDLGLV